MIEEKTNPNSAANAVSRGKAESVSAAPRITNTQKEKDPRKVEAGKKLGAISKMAKNQKKYKAEAHEAESVSADNDQNQDYSTAFYAVFTVVVVGCLGIIYVTKQRSQEPKKPPNATATPPPLLAHRGAHSNLISLDD